MKTRSGSAHDQRVVDALDEVLAVRRAGRPLSRRDFLARHPGLADELARYLDNLALIIGPEDDERDGIIGGTLGDFRVIREIGRGGMGVVYEAEQISLNRRVALKVLPFAAIFDRQLQRFKNEAQAAASLHHTNIVPVHAVGQERGVHFYAMQFIDGKSLAQIIEELRAAPGASSVELSSLTKDRSTRSIAYCRAVARLAIQAAEAIDHAHQSGVVHRDIKPGNLMLDGSAHLWITDFGLASFERNTGVTMTGDLIGTVRYMSPEQAMANRVPVDHRTDIYSLGATLYELLTLNPPHPGEDAHAVMHAIAYDEPRAPRKGNDAIPQELETILLKAMAKDAPSRYATAHDFADDLRRFLEHKPVLARRPTALDRAWKWGQRHRAAVLTGLALLLLAIAGLATGTVLVARERQRVAAALRLAEDNLDSAIEAVDRMLKEVGAEWLADVPQMEPIRRRLLESALEMFEDFLERHPDRPELEPKIADTLRRVGEIHGLLGGHDDAVAAYRQALQRFRALEDDAEAAATLLALSGLAAATHDYDEADRLARDALALHESGRGRADALGQLAGFLRLRGKEDEAVGMMKEAIAELERLPPDDEVRAQLAGRLGELGRWLMQARPDEARALFRRARPLWEDLVSRLKRPAQRWAFGAMHHPESWLAESPAEAVRICEEAVELLDELVREHPVIPRYRVTLSSLQNCLNIHLQRDDRPSEALVHIEQALANARELHARFPEVERGRYLVASYLGNLGNVQFDLGDRETARESFREATERMEALVRDTKSEASRESKPTYGMVHITRERPDYDLWLEVAHMREAQLWESFGDYARAIECESLKATPRLDLARLLLMCPDRSMRDPHRALAITRERGRLETEWYALAQLRLGRLDEARRAIVPALKRPARSPSQHAKALRWIVHALILHHSGDADGARTELARAREWIAEQRPFKGGYHRYRTGIVERFADDAAREMAEGTSQEK